MGVQIDNTNKNCMTIEGKGISGLSEPEDVLNLGNSGTSLRLLSGLLAGQDFFSVLTGDESLRRRPMKRIIEPLTKMGAEILGRGEGSFAPIAIEGRELHPIDYTSPVASAQVKSAVLLAGLTADGKTSVTEPAKSRDHTERMLKGFGVEVEEEGLTVRIKGRATFEGRDINIPGDLSSAAFFIVAGTIVKGSNLTIKDVGLNPTRTGFIDVLKEAGANIRIEELHEVCGEPVGDISIRASQLKGIEIGGDAIPRTIDEFPILCVAFSVADGETIIRDAKELRYKETDRIHAIAIELRKMGIDLDEMDDGLRIRGGRRFSAAVCQSHGDHRVAMALPIAGLVAEGETVIEDTDCINTSFPGFMETLELLIKN